MIIHPIDAVYLDKDMHLIVDKRRYEQMRLENPLPDIDKLNLIIPLQHMERAIMNCINQYQNQEQRNNTLLRYS